MKKISASGIKSADFRIRIAEKTYNPPPIDCLKSEWPHPYMHSLKTGTPPYILPPHPPPLKFMNSPLPKDDGDLRVCMKPRTWNGLGLLDVSTISSS